MKKFLISETEKKEILDKHKSFKLVLENKFKQKLVLSEQITAPTGNELIQKAKNVCPTLKNGVFVKIKGNRAIKITAAKDGSLSAVNNQPKYVVGDVLIYKSDMTFDVYDGTRAANNDWFKKGTYKWKCAGLTAQAEDFKATASKQQIDAEGWMTYDEAKAANINLTDPKYFEQKNINGTEYFRKRGIIQGGAGSQEQKNVIDFLTNRYGARFQSKLNQSPQGFCWAFQGEQPLVEPQWTLEKVVGGDAFGVKEGLQIFVSPECLSKIRKASKEVVSTESGFRKIDNDTCKDFLKNYMEAYENDVDTTTTAFTQLKKDVQSCKRKFCSKNISKTQGKCEGTWKLGFMGGSRKLDDIIDFFSGENNPIGTPPERTNPYRIA